MGRVSPVLAGWLKLAMFAIAMKRLDFPRLALHPCARSHQFARQANLLPVRTNDNAPSHRVYVGRAEIGAAWSKRSTEGGGCVHFLQTASI
jgi:hypothetical protein